MDQNRIDKPLGNEVHGNEFAPGVEEHHLELFHRVGPVGLAQILGDPLRAIQQGRFAVQFPGQPPGQRKGGIQGDGFVGADAANALQFLERGAGQGVERLELLEQKNGDQFGVAEGVRAQFSQAFAWPLIFWKVFDPNAGSHAECVSNNRKTLRQAMIFSFQRIALAAGICLC